MFDITFIPFSGKELVLRSGTEVALKAFYESALRRITTMSKESAACVLPINVPVSVDSLAK